MDPADLARRAGSGDGTSPVFLGEFLGRPVYRVRPPGGAPWGAFHAEDGSPLPEVTASQAAEVARRFAARSGLPPGNVEVKGPIPFDQWTVSSPLEGYRPFYRVTVGDAAGTELYISLRTGEVVRDTCRSERAWNWVGAVTHWVYPAILREHVLAWRTTGRVLSLGALALVITGLVLAVRRASQAGRLPRFRGLRGRHSVAGVIFGVPVAAWLLSGFLSFRIVPLFDDGEPTLAQRSAWQGGAAVGPAQPLAWEAARSVAGLSHPVVAAEWRGGGVGDQLVVRDRSGAVVRLIRRRGSRDAWEAQPALEAGDVLARAAVLLPETAVAGIDRLEAYDAHYYSRRPGEDPRPLPAWRVRFSDPAATWFHVDSRAGILVDRLSRGARIYRWLFSGLHSWDWPWLAARRPLWDVVVLVLLAGGTGVAATGLGLAWRRRGRPPAREVSA